MLILILWITARFCHHKTEGFRLSKLKNNTTSLSNQSSPPLNEETAEILQQQFRYLGRGLQSFSFVSEDGQTVLKLFNNRYQWRLLWTQWLPGASWREKRIRYLKNKLASTFESYQLAYDLLKDECGLLYFHPQITKDCPSVTLIDKLGIAHQINLNTTGFVLQKKATLVYPYLQQCSSLEARAAILSLVKFIQKKMDLGIADRDPLIRTNLGFLDGKPMQIDLGPLSKEASIKNLPQQKEELVRITLSLKHWLESQHPEMLPYLDEALNSF